MQHPESLLVISIDFELFWGVFDSQSVESYGRNVLGVWEVLPRILQMFESNEIRATWATVGMLMCEDFEHWRESSPEMLPTYSRGVLKILCHVQYY
jgi:hypothetical protein